MFAKAIQAGQTQKGREHKKLFGKQRPPNKTIALNTHDKHKQHKFGVNYRHTCRPWADRPHVRKALFLMRFLLVSHFVVGPKQKSTQLWFTMAKPSVHGVREWYV